MIHEHWNDHISGICWWISMKEVSKCEKINCTYLTIFISPWRMWILRFGSSKLLFGNFYWAVYNTYLRAYICQKNLVFSFNFWNISCRTCENLNVNVTKCCTCNSGSLAWVTIIGTIYSLDMGPKLLHVILLFMIIY